MNRQLDAPVVPYPVVVAALDLKDIASWWKLGIAGDVVGAAVDPHAFVPIEPVGVAVVVGVGEVEGGKPKADRVLIVSKLQSVETERSHILGAIGAPDKTTSRFGFDAMALASATTAFSSPG